MKGGSLLVWISLCSLAAAAATITISGSDNSQQLQSYTARVVREALPKVAFFPSTDSIRIAVSLAASPEEFNRLVGTPLPAWVSAVTLFPEQRIVIKTPQLTHSSLREYRTTLTHELVHLLHGKLIPLNLTPRWFNEGLAIYYSEGLDYRDRIVLSRAILKKRLLDLMQLDNWFDYTAPVADLAYAESAAAVEFIVTVYGSESLTQIFRQMRIGQSFEHCLAEIIQDDYTSFPDLLAAYLRSRYAWLFLTDLQYIFWLFLSLMVVIIYWRLRVRKRVKMAEWQAEETVDLPDA